MRHSAAREWALTIRSGPLVILMDFVVQFSYLAKMIQLNEPSNKLISSYLDFIEEMNSLGETVWEGMLPKPMETTQAFVTRILRRQSHPEAGLVPETTCWATRGNEVVGRISLRHSLNDNLKEYGGHIGYEVRPSARRQGIAKEMLRKVLQTPRARQIGHLLLTCAPDNIASNKTILANGGVLEKTAFVAKWNRDTHYYWIHLSES